MLARTRLLSKYFMFWDHKSKFPSHFGKKRSNTCFTIPIWQSFKYFAIVTFFWRCGQLSHTTDQVNGKMTTWWGVLPTLITLACFFRHEKAFVCPYSHLTLHISFLLIFVAVFNVFETFQLKLAWKLHIDKYLIFRIIIVF